MTYNKLNIKLNLEKIFFKFGRPASQKLLPPSFVKINYLIRKRKLSSLLNELLRSNWNSAFMQFFKLSTRFALCLNCHPAGLRV